MARVSPALPRPVGLPQAQAEVQTAAPRGLLPHPPPAAWGPSSDRWGWRNLSPSHACPCLSSRGTLWDWPRWQLGKGEVWAAIVVMLPGRLRPDAAWVGLPHGTLHPRIPRPHCKSQHSSRQVPAPFPAPQGALWMQCPSRNWSTSSGHSRVNIDQIWTGLVRTTKTHDQ